MFYGHANKAQVLLLLSAFTRSKAKTHPSRAENSATRNILVNTAKNFSLDYSVKNPISIRGKLGNNGSAYSEITLFARCLLVARQEKYPVKGILVSCGLILTNHFG